MTSMDLEIGARGRTRRHTVVDLLLRRVRVLARHRRRLGARRRALRLLQMEMRDERWLADIGVKEMHVHDVRLDALARALGGR